MILSNAHPANQNNVTNSRDLFTLFSFMFGLYLCIHMFLIEELRASPWLYIPPLFGLWLALKPHSLWRLLLAVSANLIDSWIAFPVRSNSTMLTFILALIIIVAYLGLAWKQRRWDVDIGDLYDHFAPGGRLLLLSMYFFGIFQKINTGFLDPATSCATHMMGFFGFPDAFVAHPLVQYAAIYSTFLLEAIILICLIFPRTRYAAILIGTGFHLMLSMNFFQYFQPFTTLAFLLHILYLDRDILKRWRLTRAGRFFTFSYSRLEAVVGLCLLGWLGFIYLWFTGGEIFAYIVWLPVALSFWLFLFFCGRPSVPVREPNFFFSRNYGVTIIAALFFIQCFGPYVGFKTQQTVNMFSNLRTEGGISNHLIIRKPYYIFDYQKDLVTVLDSNDPWFNRIKNLGNQFVAMEFFDHLARNPETRVAYIYKGQTVYLDGVTEQQVKDWKLPTLAHKLMVFQTVPLDGVMHCLSD